MAGSQSRWELLLRQNYLVCMMTIEYRVLLILINYFSLDQELANVMWRVLSVKATSWAEW